MALTDNRTNRTAGHIIWLIDECAAPFLGGGGPRTVIGYSKQRIVFAKRVKKRPKGLQKEGYGRKIRTVAVPDRASGEFDSRQLGRRKLATKNWKQRALRRMTHTHMRGTKRIRRGDTKHTKGDGKSRKKRMYARQSPKIYPRCRNRPAPNKAGRVLNFGGKNTNQKAEARPQQSKWTSAGSSQNWHPAPAATCRIAIVFARCEHRP